MWLWCVPSLPSQTFCVGNASTKVTHYQLLVEPVVRFRGDSMKETKVYLLDCGTMALDQSYMFLNAGLTGMRR